MTTCQVAPIRGEAYEDSGVILMARILGYDSTPINQAAIDSISLTVADEQTQEAADPISVDVADVVFDALQTGGPWDADDTGYNFRYDSLASQRPEGDRTYRFEFKFTPSTGEPFWAVFRIETKKLLGG